MCNEFGLVQSANGLGLEAVSGEDYCQVKINFPKDTVPKWVGVNFSFYKLFFEAHVLFDVWKCVACVR